MRHQIYGFLPGHRVLLLQAFRPAGCIGLHGCDYIPRQHTRQLTVTHLSTNRARCTVMGARRNFSREGQGLGNMASAERQPITGVWSGAPSCIQGQSPREAEALKHLRT